MIVLLFFTLWAVNAEKTYTVSLKYGKCFHGFHEQSTQASLYLVTSRPTDVLARIELPKQCAGTRLDFHGGNFVTNEVPKVFACVNDGLCTNDIALHCSGNEAEVESFIFEFNPLDFYTNSAGRRLGAGQSVPQGSSDYPAHPEKTIVSIFYRCIDHDKLDSLRFRRRRSSNYGRESWDSPYGYYSD